MRILFLAHRIPFPPNKGDKIRAYHEIEGMRARGHEVHVLALVDDPADLVHRSELLRHCDSAVLIELDRRKAKVRALAAMASRRPLSLAYFGLRAMREAVARKTKEIAPERFVVYSSVMAQYVPASYYGRTVVDLVDIDSEKWRNYAESAPGPLAWIYRTEFRRLREYEHAIVRRFPQSVVATEREASLLDRLEPAFRGRLHAIVNGVDLERFSPHAALAALNQGLPSAEQRMVGGLTQPRIVLTGAMDYYPNIDAVTWFVEEVFPLIRRRHSGACFLVVGSNPTAGVKALGERPGVTVTGFVDDVRPYLAMADACVAPLRIARGVQNKVLEAMACGRPVVASSETMTGLGAQAGSQVLLASSAEEFAAAVCRTLERPEEATGRARRARAYVEREHSWQAMLDPFCDLLSKQEVVGSPV